nr:PREDICTED: centromere protein X isoform X2 [Equus przewalskii]
MTSRWRQAHAVTTGRTRPLWLLPGVTASPSDQELVSKLLHLHFKDDKTKEAAIRSIRQAQAEDLARVDVDQLEKVLPQLLLDF